MKHGDNKEVNGWFGTFMDIDDRKKIEEINKADQAKSRFLASMSHGMKEQRKNRDVLCIYFLIEMRTPLSGVIGMASLLRITPLSSEQTGIYQSFNYFFMAMNYFSSI
jgi:signal transduction histidine kinase